VPKAPVVRDVTHPDFPHGTERGYSRGCHEDCCATAKARATKIRTIRKARGIRVRTDAGPMREHLRALLAADDLVTLEGIARAAQVTSSSLSQVFQIETRTMVRSTTALAVLRLTVEDVLPHESYVRLDRPRQQVQSLMALGWTGPWISERLGIKSTGTGPPDFMYRRANRMTRELADKIDALYREIGDRPGPSRLTAMRSASRGWHVPGCYDEDGTFLPWAVRQSDEIEAAKQRKIEIAERREQVWALTEQGLQPQEIADRLGTTADVVHADRRRGLSRKAERLLLAEAGHTA
jgi:DNA-binding CsgD family transcriptional regulator